MKFQESIQVCFSKYAEFNGKASRSEFWWFALFTTLVISAVTLISQVGASVVTIALLLPFLAVGSRRLQSTGRSGWWQSLLLIPIGGLIMLAIWWSEPEVK